MSAVNTTMPGCSHHQLMGLASNIRTLAGYVTTGDGEHLAFVILINNFEGTGANANDALDAIAVRLASFTRTP